MARTPSDIPLKLGPLPWAVVGPDGEVAALCRSWRTALEILDNRPTASGWRVVELEQPLRRCE